MLQISVTFLGLWLAVAAQNGPQLRHLDDGAVLVSGLERTRDLVPLKLSDAQWKEFFAVHVGRQAQGLPMLGSYRIEADALRFVPRFPLRPGLDYSARFSPSRYAALLSLDATTAQDLLLSWRTPAAEMTPVTRLLAITPSSDRLPMNLLRLYLHFSRPMSRGEAYRHIRLWDQEGRPVLYAFLEMEPELWDPATRRLTLLFDPGRIKRGLQPHLQLGYPLQPGRSYRLTVDASWPDAEGRPLVAAGVKDFQVGDPDRQSPDLTKWRLSLPRSGTRDPLLVDLGEPLDEALLQRLLWLTDASDRRVEGRIQLSLNEARWEFHPTRPWAAGEYLLQADAWLEDTAGNNLNRPFDVDTRSHPAPMEEKPVHSRAFRIP